MVTKEQIIAKVEASINSGCSIPLVIQHNCTIEKENYFVFFYQSEQYLQTGDISYMVLGNAPIIANKQTGELHYTGTAHLVEEYIAAYEKTGSPNLH